MPGDGIHSLIFAFEPRATSPAEAVVEFGARPALRAVEAGGVILDIGVGMFAAGFGFGDAPPLEVIRQPARDHDDAQPADDVGQAVGK